MNFYRDITRTSAIKVNDVPRKNAIRLYTDSHNYQLQVRGPLRLANGGDGKDFIVAAASCSAEDLKALRAAIDEALIRRPMYGPAAQEHEGVVDTIVTTTGTGATSDEHDTTPTPTPAASMAIKSNPLARLLVELVWLDDADGATFATPCTVPRIGECLQVGAWEAKVLGVTHTGAGATAARVYVRRVVEGTTGERAPGFKTE